MRNVLAMVVLVALGAMFTGCAYLPGGTDLGQVASQSGLTNVTTGDGTFADYKATSYHEGTEIGLAVGLPLFGKFFEVYPAQSNEDLLGDVAKDAKAQGAEAMINVKPVNEMYWGFPFIIFGLYVDDCHGTGIDLK